MKIIRTLLALMMGLTTAAADLNGICKPNSVPGNRNDWIVLKEMTPGCLTDFITKDGVEVHILKLLFSPGIYPIVNLNVTGANPSILIITSTSTQTFHVMVFDNPAVILYVTNGTSVNFLQPTTRDLVQKQVATSTEGDSELLKWATDEFRGVTSFTTVLDPRTITFTGMKDSHLPSSCDLQLELPSEKPLIELDTSSNDLKSCYNEHPGEELHIINIPDDVRIRNVSVHLLHESKVVLRGPPDTQWKIHANHEIKLLSNNHIFFNNLLMHPRMAISDDLEDITRKAFPYFHSTSVTSYSVIHLNISAVQLCIGKITSSTAPPEVEHTTSAPSSPSIPFHMQLYSSPDYTSPLDPSSKVHSNKRVYAEISSETFGEISFIIKVRSCRVHSMQLERNMPFKEEMCFMKDCPKRLSFSFELLQDLPSTSWELECAVQLCHEVINFCLNETKVKRNLQVIKSDIPSPNQCFKFGLLAVLGIAFGGFMIGVLLTGVLWFIKIRTAYEGRVGESSCNKPRDDLPLEIR
ncbi:endoglin-like isoform X2 [Myxocyprinus asiaticus]|uniref:endoglin-like isoform X2 n=1 Tax=Myxocyprinus asiaticus TaxID=70543 RepID=UPI002222D610|nr:endoglin-like isoform X2 [Myxocyprinus asiaticus]